MTGHPGTLRKFCIRTGKGSLQFKDSPQLLKKLQVSCIIVIRLHALVTAFAVKHAVCVKYARRRSLPGKRSRKSKPPANFFANYTRGGREGAGGGAAWAAASYIKPTAGRTLSRSMESRVPRPFGRFFEGFITALSAVPN